MTNIEKVYSKLSKKYKLNYDTIKRICNSEFKFILLRIEDNADTKDILVHHLFKFKCKTKVKECVLKKQQKNEIN